MTNGTDMIEIAQQVNVGVSYTLNNTQPVRCSYIGSDPFFFMDIDMEDEDLDFISEEFFSSMDDMDDELRSLEQKITSFEKSYDMGDSATTARMAAFEENIAQIGLNQINGNADTNDDNIEYAPSIESLIQFCEKSRFAKALLDSAMNDGINIQYSRLVETAIFDKNALNKDTGLETGAIFVNPNLKLADMILNTAAALRKAWQFKKGAALHPLTLEPDQAVLVNRVQMADQAVAMVRVAWELSLAEYKTAWQRLENSNLKDMAHSFARESLLDFRTLNNGVAASAAFESWFLTDRCQYHDRELIQSMLSEKYADLFQARGEMSRAAAIKIIGQAGEMPFGKNYLAQYAGLITSDPVFTDIRDRSNANFLWFVKFEQSFLHTEQELQNTSGETQKTNSKVYRNYENAQSSDNNLSTNNAQPSKGASDGRAIAKAKKADRFDTAQQIADQAVQNGERNIVALPKQADAGITTSRSAKNDESFAGKGASIVTFPG